MLQSVPAAGVLAGDLDAPAQLLRIALCVDSLSAGGTELNAVRTAEQLGRRGHDVTLLALRAEGPLVRRCHDSGVAVTEFRIPPMSSAAIIPRMAVLARLLRRLRFDIVHTQDRYSNTVVVPSARLAGIPVVASRRWWDLQPSRGIRAGNRLAFRLAQHVVANSARVAHLVRDIDDVPPGKVSVVSNFLDEWALQEVTPQERLRLRSLLGVPANARVIGCVANLRPVKAHSVLLAAMPDLMRRWPDVVLVLVGEGECRLDLLQQAQRLGLDDRIIFAGSRSDPVNWHAAFDISVLASLSEGFPNTVIEGMAAGIPVVATSVGGTPDAIQHELNGMLVPAGDPEPIGLALGILLADPQRAAAMGRHARQSALSRFRASAVIPKLEQLYYSVLGERRRSGGNHVASDSEHA